MLISGQKLVKTYNSQVAIVAIEKFNININDIT